MGMKVYKNYFETLTDVLDDMKQTGHWPTTYVSEPASELPLHQHDLDVTG